MLVRTQLISSSIVIAIFTIAYSLFALYSLTNLSDGFKEIVSSSKMATERAVTIDTTAQDLSASLGARTRGFKRIAKKAIKLKSKMDGVLGHMHELIGKGDELFIALDAKIKTQPANEKEIADLILQMKINHAEASVEIVNAFEKQVKSMAYVGKAVTVSSKSLGHISDGISGISGDVNAMSLASAEMQMNAEGFSAIITKTKKWLLAATIPLVLSIIVAAVLLSRKILRPLNQAVTVSNAIASGDLHIKIDNNPKRRDEFAKLSNSMQKMRDKIIDDMESLQKTSQQAASVRATLDVCTTPVSLSDTEGNYQYRNTALTDLMRTWEDLENDNIEAIIALHGESEIDLSALKSVQQVKLTFDQCQVELVCTPVLSDNNELIGIATEWLDRTVENRMASDLERVITLAGQGHLDHKIDTDQSEGLFKSIGEQFNLLISVVNNNLTEVAVTMKSLSSGNLTINVSETGTEDSGQFWELRNGINKTIESMREVVFGIISDVDTVHRSVDSIATGNAELSDRTEQQTVDLSLTTDAMHVLTTTVSENTDSARKAKTLSGEARGLASSGQVVVQKTVSAMNEISEVSKKMSDIVSIIDDLSFQTNLLALNAAVEAARAGEQGRGFAVVATEVRNLAQKSADSAKDIRTLIDGSIEKVNLGSQFANESGEAIEDIIARVDDVDKIITEIADAGEEQLKNIQSVNTAVSSLESSVNHNKSLSGETRASGTQLQQQAKTMKERVKYFQVDSAHANDAIEDYKQEGYNDETDQQNQAA